MMNEETVIEVNELAWDFLIKIYPSLFLSKEDRNWRCMWESETETGKRRYTEDLKDLDTAILTLIFLLYSGSCHVTSGIAEV